MKEKSLILFWRAISSLIQIIDTSRSVVQKFILSSLPRTYKLSTRLETSKLKSKLNILCYLMSCQTKNFLFHWRIAFNGQSSSNSTNLQFYLRYKQETFQTLASMRLNSMSYLQTTLIGQFWPRILILLSKEVLLK